MVELAIKETLSPPLNGQPNKIVSLRDSALWFPNIPDSYLQVEKTYFEGFDPAASGFQPLCCIFRKVTNAGSLSKISVISKSSGVLVIDCHYDTGNIQRLGPPDQSSPGENKDTLVYLIKRKAGEDVEKISFLKQRESTSLVSNYSDVYFQIIQRIIYLYLAVLPAILPETNSDCFRVHSSGPLCNMGKQNSTPQTDQHCNRR
jgi:hypothetical protein